MTAQYAWSFLSGRNPRTGQSCRKPEGQATKFISDFPNVEDTPDAIMQLGMVNEFLARKPTRKPRPPTARREEFPKHALAKAQDV